MDPVAREVRMAAGSDRIMHPDGVMEIMQLLNGYFAPDAADSVYQEVACLLRFEQTAQTVDEHLVRFDPLSGKAESKMQMDGAFPAALASVLCTQHAFLYRPDKSLTPASVQGNLGISTVARQMQRQFGPCGGVVGQDVLAATDV